MLERALSILRGLFVPRSVRLDLPIYTGRLQLREFTEQDWPAFHAYLSDPEVLRYQARTAPFDEVESLDRLSYFRKATRAAPRDTCMLAIVRETDRALIGECSLCRRPFSVDYLLGFLLRRDAWGAGYATEAGSAALKLAFTSLGAHRVLAGCHPENPAARRVLEKLPMRACKPSRNFPGAPPGVLSLVFEADPSADGVRADGEGTELDTDGSA